MASLIAIRLGVLASSVLALIGVPRISAADVTQIRCSVFSRDNAPDSLRDPLALLGVMTIKECVDGKNTTYSVGSEIWRGKLSACFYSVRSIFKHTLANGENTWSVDPAPGEAFLGYEMLFAALPQPQCPPQGDAAYTQLSDVSEGEFIEIATAWKRMMSSRAAFAEATRSLSVLIQWSAAYHVLESWQTNAGSNRPTTEAHIRYVGREYRKEAVAQRYTLHVDRERTWLELSVGAAKKGLQIFDVGQPTP